VNPAVEGRLRPGVPTFLSPGRSTFPDPLRTVLSPGDIRKNDKKIMQTIDLSSNVLEMP
jgi:hypothetical protein